MMNTLHSYFKPGIGVLKQQDNHLPDLNGPLSSIISSEVIRTANDAHTLSVSTQTSQQNQGGECKRSRGSYVKLTPVQQAQIAKYALANGNKAAIVRYTKEFQTQIKMSSVSTWKAKYESELKHVVKNTCSSGNGRKDIAVLSLPSLKRGRPLLLGENLDRQVKSYIIAVREKQGIINTAITVAFGEAIVKKTDKNLLRENGGLIELTKVWAKSLLQRLNFVKRKATTSAKVEPSHFKELKEQFLLDIKAVVEMEDVPSDLILNWDHTGINIVPSSTRTMEAKESKRVEAVGLNDKRQITAVFCAALSGEFLPLQLIYQGKTTACLPRFAFPSEWNIMYTPNHWSNEQKTKEYIHKIILPYAEAKRNAHERPNQTALVIFDEFKDQVTDDVYNPFR